MMRNKVIIVLTFLLVGSFLFGGYNLVGLVKWDAWICRVPGLISGIVFVVSSGILWLLCREKRTVKS